MQEEDKKLAAELMQNLMAPEKLWNDGLKMISSELFAKTLNRQDIAHAERRHLAKAHAKLVRFSKAIDDEIDWLKEDMPENLEAQIEYLEGLKAASDQFAEKLYDVLLQSKKGELTPELVSEMKDHYLGLQLKRYHDDERFELDPELGVPESGLLADALFAVYHTSLDVENVGRFRGLDNNAPPQKASAAMSR